MSDQEYAPPDVYEHDLRDVVTLIEKLKTCEQVSDLYITGAKVWVHSRNDYAVGVLTYGDEQWKFTPCADSFGGSDGVG